MKKKCAFIAVLFAMVLMLGACSDVQKEYLKEAEKLGKWEYSDSNYDIEMNMEFKVQDESIKTEMNQKVAGFTVNIPKNVKAEALMDMDMVVQGGSEEVKISYKDLTTYVDNDKIYMPLELFEQSMPEDKKFPEDKKYLLIDGKASGMGEFNSQLMQIDYIKDPQKMFELYTKLGELLDLEINTVKKDGKYVTVINKDDFLKITDKLVEKFATNSKEIVEILQLDKMSAANPNMPNDAVDKMKNGLTKEEAESLKSMYKTMRPELEKAIKDLKIEAIESFSEDNYKTDVSIKVDTEPFKFELKMNGGQKKADKKEIKMPESKEVMEYKEFEKYLPKAKSLIINPVEKKIYHGTNVIDIKVLNKNGKEYYEARPVIEALEGKVGWDANKKTVTVDINGNHYEVKLLNEGGVSFIDSEGLKSIGLDNAKVPNQDQVIVTVK